MPMQQHAQAGLGDCLHERLTRIDADGSQEYRQTEITQHDVGRQSITQSWDRSGAACRRMSATISGPPPIPRVTTPTPGMGMGINPSRMPRTMPMPEREHS